ncbi:ATP-binding protein [uncultured Tateyamaria sp.]|uniref:sensor histidine kinase n=1 Tax=uncultured Tateyamaria sp. TaxID=455651 RepID=UPI00262C8AF6|nr:ATP-binding protein [uncultured Tateyamaria sp.]
MTRRFFTDPLGYRLVLASLLIGSVLSVFSTGIQLLTSFNRQKEEATAVFTQIETALAGTLEQALWTFDFDQVNILLDGIASNEDITHVELVSQTGHRWERGAPSEAPVQRVYPLSYSRNGQVTQELGKLRVELTLAAVINNLREQFWVILMTNLIKAYLAAVALLYVVHRMITRHLRTVARHVDNTGDDPALQPLVLDREKRRKPDDLDHIVSAIRQFERRVQNDVAALKSEITERRKSEAQAREALSVRSSFIGTMSHEVRTPLNAILGFLHLIEIDEAVPERQRHYARVATRASQQLLNQLNNVLEMSRLDSNAVSISTRPTDIRRLAQQWQDTTHAAIHFHEKDIEVVLELEPPLREKYELDGARVTQIVTNLTDNAAKFTQSGTILISIRETRDPDTNEPLGGLQISVSDTGPGIDRAQCTQVFERFTQLDTRLERTHGGSGLGLAICLELSHLMGADLTVIQPERDGFTTEFLLVIHSADAPEAQNE